MTRQELRREILSQWCGCGFREAACAALLNVLRLHLYPDDETFDVYYGRREAWCDRVGDEHWLILYWLDHIGLTEHGGSVSSAWLTGKGYDVLEALEREEADGFEALNRMHCVHGYDVKGDDTHDCATADTGLDS